MDTSTHYVNPESISVEIKIFDDFIAVDINFRTNIPYTDVSEGHQHTFMVHLDQTDKGGSLHRHLGALALAFPNHTLTDTRNK